MTQEQAKGEVQREAERRAAIIERWGAQPPVLAVGESLPMATTGDILVLDGSHTVERNGKVYFVGIDKQNGWVQTDVEAGTILGG